MTVNSTPEIEPDSGIDESDFQEVDLVDFDDIAPAPECGETVESQDDGYEG